MNRAPILALLLFGGGLLAQTTPLLGIRSHTPELRAFTHARIVTAPGQEIEQGTLVIDHGKIVAVGADIRVPAGATVIDLAGKTIYPGFVEPYTDYGLEVGPTPPKPRHYDSPVWEAERIGGDAWNDAIHTEVDWSTRFRPDSDAAEKMMRQGFTSVQTALLDGVFQGRACVVSLGDGLPNDLILRDRTWQFLSFNKGSSRQAYPESLMGCIAMIRQTLLDADWYAKAHAAYALNPKQDAPEYNTALEALKSLPQEMVFVGGSDDLDLMRIDKIGREFSLKVVPIGTGAEYRHLAEVKATGRDLIIPVDFPDVPDVSSYGNEMDVSLRDLRHWDWAPSNPATLEDSSIRFAFTTHGLKKTDDFLKNVRRAVQRGLSEKTALAALTTIPADLSGVAAQVGTLEPGKRADFIVCDGDIFDDDTRVLAAFTLGMAHEFTPLDEITFSGVYQTTVSGASITLNVGDSIRRGKRCVSIEAVRGEVKVKGPDPYVYRERIEFRLPLDSLELPGVYRFTGWLSGDTLSGEVTAPDDTRSVWQAARTAPGAKRSEGREKQAADTLPVGQLTYPNMAFGVSSLPPVQTVLIKNATIWTSEDNNPFLDSADMLVVDGHIKAVGRGLIAPSSAVVIDATGKYLTAGVIDEHSHMCISGDVNECTSVITSETRIRDVVDPDDINIYRSLAGGVTLARTLHGSCNAIGGQDAVIKLRWGANDDHLLYENARPGIKMALGENVVRAEWGEWMRNRYPITRMGVDNVIKDAFQAAKEYGQAWKTYNALDRKTKERTIPPRRDLRLEAIQETINSQRFITCHAYVQSEILALMRLAEAYNFRVAVFTHILEGYKLAEEMARHGAGGGSAPDWWAYKWEVYDAIPHNPCLMTEKGVVVSINSDSPALQRHLNQEAAKSIMYCGMSEAEAWKMVTINPARQLKIDQYTGSLKEGKEADFVIWNGNPLSIYSHPEQTWIDGRKYFDIADDLTRRELVERERLMLVQKALRTEKKNDWPGGGDWKPDDHMETSTDGCAGCYGEEVAR